MSRRLTVSTLLDAGRSEILLSRIGEGMNLSALELMGIDCPEALGMRGATTLGE